MMGVTNQALKYILSITTINSNLFYLSNYNVSKDLVFTTT